MRNGIRFPFVAGALFVLFAGIVYFPVLQGKIPFPALIFYYFPAFQDSPMPPPDQPIADNGDLLTSFYMFRALPGRTLDSGILPLWNPYILAGAPLLGHSQTSLFYLPNLVFYVADLPLAWSLALIIRMILAGLFMALLIRAVGGTPSGAILSGLVFSACGVIVTWQGYSRGDTAIWLPFVCYAIVLLKDRISGLRVALAAVAFAMPVFAGHPETAVHIAMVAVSLLAVLFIWPRHAVDETRRLGWLCAVLGAGILSIGVASIQLLPTIEFLREMPSRFQMAWPTYPAWQFLGLVSRDLLRSPNSGGIFIPEGAAYVGMVSLALVSIAPFFKDKRYFGFFLAITVIGFAIVYSAPPMEWLVKNSPLRVLKNIRMVLIGSFGLAGLAGLGLSALEEETIANRRRLRALLSLGVVFALALLLVYELKSHTPLRIEFLRRPSFSRALLIVAVLPIALNLFGLLRRRVAVVMICVIAAFDLATYSYGYTSFSRSQEISPGPAFLIF